MIARRSLQWGAPRIFGQMQWFFCCKTGAIAAEIISSRRSYGKIDYGHWFLTSSKMAMGTEERRSKGRVRSEWKGWLIPDVHNQRDGGWTDINEEAWPDWLITVDNLCVERRRSWQLKRFKRRVMTKMIGCGRWGVSWRLKTVTAIRI